MGQRFVPIVIAVSDGNSEQVVKGLTNAFSHLDQTAERAGSGGMRNAFIQADLTSRAIAMAAREVMEAAREYLQFGRELTNLNTLLDDGASLSSYRDGLLELDPALGRTSELARGMYQAISSGVAAEDSLDAITASAKAARAGLTDTFTTVDAGTSVMASFGLKSDDLTNIYDKMFETVKRGKVEFSQLASGIGLVANIAAQSGVGVNEMFAAIATASRTNRPTVAIEGMRTALTNILKPSQQATELAQSLGIEFDAQALKAKGLAKFLNEVAAATGGDAAKMAVLFGDVQALNFVMSVTGNQAKTFANDLVGVANASGTVEAAFQKQRQSLGAQFEEVKVSFERNFIQTFLKVEPLLTGTLSFVNKYPAVFGAAIVVVTGLAAGHALYNTQLGISAVSSIPKLIAGLTSVVFWMGNYRTALMAVRTASVVGDVTPFLAASLGWVALAAAVGLVVYQIYKAATAQRELVQVNTETAISVSKRVSSTTAELQSLESLRGTVNRTAEQQKQLENAYAALNGAARGRVAVIDDETQKLQALIEEKKRNLQLDLFTQQTTSYQLVNNLIIALEDQAKAQKELNAAREAYNKATANRQAADNDFALADALKYQRKASEEADAALTHLGQANGSVEQASKQIVALSTAAEFNIDQMFQQARTAGLVSGSFDKARGTVDGFARSQGAAKAETDRQTGALRDQNGAVIQQTEALKHLKDVQDSMSQRRTNIGAATIDIINNAKSAAEAKQQVAEKYKNDPAFRENVDTDRRIKANQQAVDSYVSPSASGGARAARSQISAADQGAQAEIKQGEIAARTAERFYKEVTTAAQREYDLREISLQEFVTKQIAAEETLKTFKLQALESERLAAFKLSKATARDTKLQDINERDAQIVSDANLKIQQIKDSAQKTELGALRTRIEQQLTLRDELDRRAIENTREMTDLRAITYEDAERDILAIQTTAFNRRLEYLTADEQANINNVEERIRINDQIKFLTEQQISLQENAGRLIAAGRERDLENLRRYGSEIRALAEENMRMAQDIGDARIDRSERLGANPRYLKQERLGRAIDAENELNLRNLDRISATFDVDFTKKSAEEIAKIQDLFNERLELEEVRHQDRLQEIRERPLVAYLQKLNEVATQIGDFFGDAFAGLFEKGRSFWGDMAEGFRRMFQQIVRDFIASKVKEMILSLLNPPKENSKTAANSSGGFSIGNILGSVKNLFGFGGTGSPLTPGFAGGASPAASLANTGASSLTAASTLAAGGGFFGLGASTAAASTGAAAATGAAVTGTGAAATGAAATGSAGASAGLLALATNPITIGIAAAAVGGLLLWRHFRNGTEKALKKEIAREYQIDVRDMKILKEVKGIGESTFGRGQVKKHLAEVVRLDQVKELLANYAESTGQKSSKLTTNAQFGDPNFEGNQFIRRINGGVIPGSSLGYDHRPVLADGGEYMLRSSVASREGVGSLNALNEGRARIVPEGFWRRWREKVRAQMQAENAAAPNSVSSSRASSSGSGASRGNAGTSYDPETKAILNRLATAVESLEGIDGEQLVAKSLNKNPRVAMDAVNASAKQGHGREQLQKNVGL